MVRILVSVECVLCGFGDGMKKGPVGGRVDERMNECMKKERPVASGWWLIVRGRLAII